MLLKLRKNFLILKLNIIFSKSLSFSYDWMEQIRPWRSPWLDPTLQRCDNYNVFKSNILKFIRPSSNLFFDCHNPIKIKNIVRSRVGLSHLWEHKFKQSFKETLNAICNCGNDVESAIHFSSTVPYIVMNVTHSWAV